MSLIPAEPSDPRATAILPPGLPQDLVALPAGLLPLGTQLSMPGAVLGRRRVVLRESSAHAERPAILEWFPCEANDPRLKMGTRRLGLCHVHLLSLLRLGSAAQPASPALGYAVSQAPAGIDLLTVLRLWRARGASEDLLPAWWFVAIVAAAAEGALVLHRHLGRGPGGARHGGIHPGNIFIGWDGEVQLLAFSGLPDPLDSSPECPVEIPQGPRLWGPFTDVFALCRLLRDLLPAEARDQGDWPRVLAAGMAPHPGARLALPDLIAALRRELLRAAPLNLAEAIGATLGQICPREAAEEASTVDLLAAWEDIWQPEAQRDVSSVRATAPSPAVAAPAAATPPRHPWRWLALPAALLVALSLYFAISALLASG